ncbi:hypothetical protein PENSPDRAFT_671546 [Peniophora sp. CONT]|nr:hypothetical protein PENSPDRAFT_671546 [Peniophora sp. CONT]
MSRGKRLKPDPPVGVGLLYCSHAHLLNIWEAVNGRKPMQSMRQTGACQSREDCGIADGVDTLYDTGPARVFIEYHMVVVPPAVHLHKLLSELDMLLKSKERNNVVWSESINGREEAVLQPVQELITYGYVIAQFDHNEWYIIVFYGRPVNKDWAQGSFVYKPSTSPECKHHDQDPAPQYDQHGAIMRDTSGNSSLILDSGESCGVELWALYAREMLPERLRAFERRSEVVANSIRISPIFGFDSLGGDTSDVQKSFLSFYSSSMTWEQSGYPSQVADGMIIRDRSLIENIIDESLALSLHNVEFDATAVGDVIPGCDGPPGSKDKQWLALILLVNVERKNTAVPTLLASMTKMGPCTPSLGFLLLGLPVYQKFIAN